jgi:hypothetical protein
MWPKEHGAYGQLAFPLATAFAVAGITWPAFLTGAAAVASFLAYEPWLVLVGRRGPRASRDQDARATAWLAVSGTAAMTAGAVAVWLSPPDTRWAFVLPALPAALFGLALAREQEKSVMGEIAAAAALSMVAAPTALAAGASFDVAVAIGGAFALVSVASTLGVRVVVLRVRGGGDHAAVRLTRWLFVIVSACVTVGLTAAAASSMLPWVTLSASAPGVAVAALLVFRPPPPTRLRTVGWTLVSTSALAALMLIAGLRVP